MHLRSATLWARLVFLLAIVLAGTATAWFWRDTRGEKAIQSAVAAEPFQRSRPPALPVADPWEKPGAQAVRDEVERYVLAGTFQTYAFAPGQAEGRPQTRLAIIDDRRSGRQTMVSVQDPLGAFTVTTIETDHVTLERGGQEWVLRLTGRLASGVGKPVPVPETKEEGSFEDMPALGSSRFGKRIAENQWVIQRAAIMAYANELMEDPRRYAALYQSFAPEPGEGGMSGFRIKPAGEKELFESLGLGDQDVIRKVNSMQMTNNRRAEYLISEFMKARMSAVVLDIERDGQEEKRIYIIR